MSKSKQAVELCALLVDETYGELTSRIFTVLLRRGRLQLRDLAKHTGLTPYQLKHGLVVLIQQNLVYHHAPTEWVNAEHGDLVERPADRTFYEASHDGAYNLVRTGKVMEVVQERHGDIARDVMEHLFLLGHAKVSDLAAQYATIRSPGKVRGEANGVHKNGVAEHACLVSSDGQLDSVLLHLLNCGLVEPVSLGMFKSPTDTADEIEAKLVKQQFGGSVKGAKQKTELEGLVNEELRTLEEQRRWRPRAPKRSLNGSQSNGSNKRLKLTNGVNGDHAYEDEGIQLDRNLIVRINYEKCIVALRSRRLVEAVEDRIGEVTSQIYAEVLRLLEEKIQKCSSSGGADGPTVTTMELMEAMSKTINPATGIGKALDRGSDLLRSPENHSGQKRKAGDSGDEEDEEHGVNGNDGYSVIEGDDPFTDTTPRKDKKRAVTFEDIPPKKQSAAERENHMLHLKNHLALLESSEKHFLRHCGPRGQGEWTVDFERAVNALREVELDAIIYEDFGADGHRLVRILRKFGRLEEKQISSIALIRLKDARTKLLEMQMAGVVDIQEIPKDSTKLITRVLFLWFFDGERVTAIVLDGLYKAMSRILQRLQVEKAAKASVIDLSERTDVRGAEATSLAPDHLEKLKEFRERENVLLGQLGRLDELVGIFRDY